MPLFEFECPICGTKAESIQSFEAAAPVCSNDLHEATMRRLISVPYRAIITKGCTGAQLH